MKHTIPPGLNVEHTLFAQSGQLQAQDQAGGADPLASCHGQLHMVCEGYMT